MRKLMDLTKRLKEEAHYIKVGAKVLPSVAGKKIKEYAKGKFAEAKEQARLQKEVEAEAKKAEREAYREELIVQAKARGTARGKSKVGKGGLLAQLGEIGNRINIAGDLGLDLGSGESGSSSGFLFEGLGEPKKKRG